MVPKLLLPFGVTLKRENENIELCMNTVGCTVQCTDLVSKGLFGCDEDTARVWSSSKHSEDGKLGTDGLPTASRSTHKHIIISVVESIEHWQKKRETRLYTALYYNSSSV